MTLSATRPFLSCDWGTSSFRLRWIDPGGHVAREHLDNIGARTLHERWMARGGGTPDLTLRAGLFSAHLRSVLDAWHSFDATLTQPIPLVISGMATSSIGWKELPYARAPLSLDGQGLAFEKLEWDKPPWVGATFLISGVATRLEMMRGEETEAIGLLSSEPSLPQRALLVLPGTHSKHVSIENGQITDFSTHMTGELFEILAKHSILKASIDPGAMDDLSAENLAAFAEGARWARGKGLSRAIFRTRTRAVLEQRPPAENGWFLSGVLIGAELAELAAAHPDRHIYVAGAGPFGALYAKALRALEIKPATLLPAARVERAAALGHAIFLQTRV